MLTSARAEVKVRLHPRACPECSGSGQIPTHEGELDYCRSCDGFGRQALQVRSDNRTWIATVGQDTIEISDEGCTLHDFVSALEDGWELCDEDVAVWEMPEEEGAGPVIVCLLRSGPMGQCETLMMEN
jgi:hypothetical protein